MFRNNLSEKFVSDGPEILIKLNPEWPRHANVADFLFCLLETFCRSFQWPTKLHVAAGFKGWISQSEFIRRLIVKFGSTDMGVPGWGDKAISKVIAKKKKNEREKKIHLCCPLLIVFSRLFPDGCEGSPLSMADRSNVDRWRRTRRRGGGGVCLKEAGGTITGSVTVRGRRASISSRS